MIIDTNVHDIVARAMCASLYVGPEAPRVAPASPQRASAGLGLRGCDHPSIIRP